MTGPNGITAPNGMTGPHRPGPQSRLAEQLLRQAISTFGSVAAGDRDAALAALDAFIEAPCASRYLAASRALRDARRGRGLALLRKTSAERAWVTGLEAVRTLLGPTEASTLSAMPVDEKAGLRLRALATLVTAHRELAERVSGQADAMRRQLALGDRPEKREPIRRIVRKRPRAARSSRAKKSPPNL